MTEYRVLEYFRWGQLNLNPGQILEIESQSDVLSFVTVMHEPTKRQLVGTKAVTSMVELKKIVRL